MRGSSLLCIKQLAGAAVGQHGTGAPQQGVIRPLLEAQGVSGGVGRAASSWGLRMGLPQAPLLGWRRVVFSLCLHVHVSASKSPLLTRTPVILD